VPLQDWLPRPAERDDIQRRLVALCRGAEEKRLAGERPVLDCDGHLHLGESWVELPSLVRRVAHGLLTRFSAPVSSAELAAARFTDEHILCRRVRWLSACVNPLGLEVISAPGGRYVMRLCATAETRI
jgi:hypothetical protein